MSFEDAPHAQVSTTYRSQQAQQSAALSRANRGRGEQTSGAKRLERLGRKGTVRVTRDQTFITPS